MFGWIWQNIFYNPILNISMVLYHAFGDNLGWAIIVLAILFRLLLLPLVKKQNEMSKKMATLKPQLDALQKKYANNKEKLSQEQIKLYRKVGYNPLGCLTTVLPQFLIVIILSNVIRNIGINNLSGMYPFVHNFISGGNEISVNMGFLGIDLTKIFTQIDPRFGKEGITYLALSLIVGLSQFAASKITMVMQKNLTGQSQTKKKEDKKKKKKPTTEEETLQKVQEGLGKSTSFILPAMTVFFAIKMPAYLSVYWIAQSLALVLQYMILDWDKSKKGVQNLFTQLKKKKESKTEK
mgnify:CR=1 FL=1